MNKLKKKIVKKIYQKSGSISLDEFIDICLFDENGYYKKKYPIGKSADYTTAPEISQLFGEILGIYIYNFWKNYLNCGFNLVELGPGKGTLLDDILRICKHFKNFLYSVNLNLVEINPRLMELQKKNLKKYNNVLKKIRWSKDFNPIKKQPSIIFANEFFDCFGIKQFINIDKKWYEKHINFNNEEDKFFIYNKVINNQKLIKKLNTIHQQSPNQIIEISDKRSKYFKNFCNFIKKYSGIIIIIDYGYKKNIHYSSLQSIKSHRHTNILDNPGNQDITSLVNFKNFEQIAHKIKLHVYGTYSQKEFLESNGIKERKNNILKKASTNQKKSIEKGYERLVANDQMGKTFKCLIISSCILN